MGTGGSLPRGQSGRGVKMTTHLQLVPRSGKRGSIHQLTHTLAWCTAQLAKNGDNLTITLSAMSCTETVPEVSNRDLRLVRSGNRNCVDTSLPLEGDYKYIYIYIKLNSMA
jgi:hypothetical protein